ncbi:hypothetical protein D6D12_05195 [Aureobasidium pullulans]|uniref:Histidine kinase/HSP90-like ATPase domain-containing protein n=1 Tax=Aureobasidium pullulans TaxID=5580 RepID=A0AB74JTI8_AURPU|nr:hypothetical protein D6D12_05195 [Aureobasidium pullulans]THX46586.1 hypothetical protein D6D11_06790 [Aureobasidium pullulans]
MAIEDVLIEGDEGLTAVCCTSNLTLQAINNFLERVKCQDDKERLPHTLTLILDLGMTYSGASAELRGEDPSTSVRGPFLGMGYFRIHEVLKEMIEHTGSDLLESDWFLVLDERSDETQSAVMVNVGDLGVRSLRVDYPVSARYLAAAAIANPPIDELAETVGEGGILRD